MAKIRKGDLVEVITGSRQDRGGDRGKQGIVLQVLVDENRVIVEGVNYVTKHTRVGQTQRGTKTGGIETIEAPIHISNVALVDPETKRAARVGFREETVTKDGETKIVRTRYFKPSRRSEKAGKATKPAESKAAKSDKADKSEKTAAKAAKSTAKEANEKDAE